MSVIIPIVTHLYLVSTKHNTPCPIHLTILTLYPIMYHLIDLPSLYWTVTLRVATHDEKQFWNYYDANIVVFPRLIIVLVRLDVTAKSSSPFQRQKCIQALIASSDSLMGIWVSSQNVQILNNILHWKFMLYLKNRWTNTRLVCTQNANVFCTLIHDIVVLLYNFEICEIKNVTILTPGCRLQSMTERRELMSNMNRLRPFAAYCEH